MVIIRIQRPSTRRALTALNDCEPPETCITASVRPCVGRTDPSASGSQSIWLFITPVSVPCRSGLTQTCPSDQSEAARRACTLGWSAVVSSGSGRPSAWKIRTSPPIASRRRAASWARNRLKERSRSDP